MVSSVGWPAGSITQTAPGRAQPVSQVGEGGCADSTAGPAGGHRLGALVVDHHAMAAFEEPLHHIAAHAAQAYHA